MISTARHPPTQQTQPQSQQVLPNISTVKSVDTNKPKMHAAPKRSVSENDLKTKEEKDKRLKQLDLLHTIGTGTFGRVMVSFHSYYC